MEQHQQQKHHFEMRRKQQELEDRAAFTLAEAERDREQQIRKVRGLSASTPTASSILCTVNILSLASSVNHPET